MPQSLTTDEIRRRWIAFFVAKGHKHVPSDSLVPQNDPSLLFTGAGMNQFKDHFLGRAKLDWPHQRAVTVQKCIRTGDIDNVGRTPNHHTFFEMLGNFSFGDYFKKEAVAWAWEFCTDAQAGLGLEKQRLSVTIFGGDAKLGIEKDLEAEAAWRASAPELRNADGSWRIYTYGEHDNFWPADAPSLGPNGPCGPCSEIYYDIKPEQGAPEPVANSADPDRYCEIWNLVFTQFNRVDVGKLEPLSQQNIDTGAGLERMARVLQRKPNNYEIDLLFPIVQEVAKLAVVSPRPSGERVGRGVYGQNFDDDRRMRRITDHTRSAVFCIADGVAPKNEGRNYVVRRLMRRAILDGRELGITKAFLGAVARVAIKQMSVGYPELLSRADTLVRLIEEEEAAFSRALANGRDELELQLRGLVYRTVLQNPRSRLANSFPIFRSLAHSFPGFRKGSAAGSVEVVEETTGSQKGLILRRPTLDAHLEMLREWRAQRKLLRGSDVKMMLNGSVAYYLYETYGFPHEIIAESAAELGIIVDMNEFQKCFHEAQERSRAGSTMAKEIFAGGPVAELKQRFAGQGTKFKGYDTLNADATVRALIDVKNNALAERMDSGEALVLLDQTPFYGESGGQVGDTGWLCIRAASVSERTASLPDGRGSENKLRVIDTQKQEGLVLHRVAVTAPLAVQQTVNAEVDPAHRLPTIKNHSATHLLHHALRGVLGTHVEQRGSLVAPGRLRFDFTHFEQVTAEQLTEIERRVNALIVSDFKIDTQELPIAEAKAKGAMALFGEKYGELVRVVTMGPSVELCGGTHCAKTGEIGYFRIVAESSIAAGVRRIEALTGAGAVADARRSEDLLGKLASTLKTRKDALAERVAALLDEKAAVERELDAAKRKAAAAAAGELLANVREVKGAKLLVAQIDGDTAALRTTLDSIRKNLKDGAVVLGGAKDGKVALLVSFPPELVKRGAHAGNLLKELAPKVGGKGGGKQEMAQGGGTDAAKLPDALAAVEGMLAAMLN